MTQQYGASKLLRMHPLVWIAIFLAPAVAAPADRAKPSDFELICAHVSCRPATTIKLRLDGGRVFEVTLPKTPYYYKGVLNILPGETLFLEGDNVGGQITNLRPVAEVKNKAKTIIVQFMQLSKPKLDRHMLLTVTNPFSKSLRYQAVIQRPEKDHPDPTSTCAVAPGLQSLEHWPEPLAQVLMTDFRLIDPRSEEAKNCD